MRILYADYQMLSKSDIIESFRTLGHTVEETDLPIKYEGDKEGLELKLDSLIIDGGYELVFTSNFHPELARVCDRNKVKYMSWIYDSPQILIYDKSICSPYVYAFHFDSEEAERLRACGVKNMWYMPLAVNPRRLDKIEITEKDKELFTADVSLVASLYNEEHNLYDRMAGKLDDYTKGFLEAILAAQGNLFGGNVIDMVLADNTDVIGKMYKAMPYPIAEGNMADLEYVYANYFLCRKAASIQRIELITEISKRFDMKVYSGGDLSAFPHVKHMGTVDYLTDMNKVFKCSKINLNITLPSIHAGIPLRALDIMGAGGFLLTNWQKDFDGLFSLGEDYGCYTSRDELFYAIEYYLDNEEERLTIQQNGTEKVTQGLSYEVVLSNMLELVEGAV